MATTISNPASFSSVRTAFNAEGYGLSTSFFAYRQGGGIVPATSPFNAIGAGTGGDPLQLSQFNGFVVPSPSGTASLSAHTLSATALAYNDVACSALTALEIRNDRALYGLANANGDDNTMIIDGTDYANPSGTSGYIAVQNWLSAGGDVSLWSCQAVPISGTPDAGSAATNTWLSMSSNRLWSVTAASNSSQRSRSKIFSFTLQLALTSDTSTVLASATMQLSASSTTQSGEEP